MGIRNADDVQASMSKEQMALLERRWDVAVQFCKDKEVEDGLYGLKGQLVDELQALPEWQAADLS